jgi:hypothetical protein
MPKRISPKPQDKSLEAVMERARKKFQADFGDQIHYSRDAKDDPRVQAFNKVMKKQRLRKVN